MARCGAQAAPRLETVLKPVRDGGAEVVAIEVRSVLTQGEGLVLSAPVTYAGVRGVADRVQGLTVTDAKGAVPLASVDDPAAPGGFPYFRHWTAQRAVTYPVKISYRSAVQPAGAPQGPPFGIRPSAGGVSGAGRGHPVVCPGPWCEHPDWRPRRARARHSQSRGRPHGVG